jgi:hypothetical protein
MRNGHLPGASMYGTESIYELGINEGEADLGTASLGYYLMRRTGGQGRNVLRK